MPSDPIPQRDPETRESQSLAAPTIELLKQNNSGSLSTFSVKHPEFPFASVASYCMSPQNEPVFFFSSMATHSKNLRSNPNAALLVTASQSASALAGGRATVMGTLIPVEENIEEIRKAYLAANPDAAQWMSFGDFQFYRMEVVDIYFVAGFGVMGWIRPEEISSQ
ncbi:MAG: HugZ family protein [Mariniblastus sp.]